LIFGEFRIKYWIIRFVILFLGYIEKI